MKTQVLNYIEISKFPISRMDLLNLKHLCDTGKKN